MNYADFLQYMTDLKSHGLQEGIPNVTELNGKFLHVLATSKKAKNILEIGTANGYSTLWLADAAKRVGGYVTSIEINMESHGQAKEHASNCGLSDCIDFIEGDAEAFVPFMDRKFDFVFIDARKGSYLEYFKAVLPKLDDHALVVLDDVIKFKNKMLDLYAFMEKEYPNNHIILPIDGDDGVMLYQHTPLS